MQISIIEFSLENFKTFKNKATFSMVAPKNKHTFESNGENILKTSFIYGPNATGKTSILEGFELMKQGILLSANNKENAELPFLPFLASEETSNKPVSLELVFSATDLFEGVYRYSFSFLKDHIITENMVRVSSSGKEEELISRDNQNIKIGKDFFDAEILSNKTRKESLFLSVSAQFNDKFALAFINALRNINTLSSINYKIYQQFTIKKFKEDLEFRQELLKYLNTADFSISDGSTEEVDIQNIDIKDNPGEFSATKNITKMNVLSLEHSIYDKDSKKISSFKLLLDQESIGTQKFISVMGPIIDTLKNGKVLLVDEFDNSLHPLLTKFIIDLFESSETNKKNAQLIVTTHDTSLLSYRDEFIKDQFWFTEKDEFGSAKLFSLAEFDMRNDTEYAKKYLEGRFGALPIIGSVKI